MSPIEERTNRTYILDEDGNEVAPVVTPQPPDNYIPASGTSYPLPQPWPTEDDKPAKREKEE